MKLSLLVAILLAPILTRAITSSGLASQKVTPVEKVVQLLAQLDKKLTAESKVEAEQYDKYACFCKEQSDSKLYAIEKSTKKIALLTAKTSKLDADISELSKDITALTTTISVTKGKIEDGVTAREAAFKKYSETEADLSGAIAAMESAIKALKDSKTAMSDAKVDLAQVRALGSRVLRSLPAMASQGHVDALRALMQIGQKPASYTYHSNDILGTLESLKDEFLQNKKELDTSEKMDNSAFEKKDLNLRNTVKFAEEEMTEKEQIIDTKSEEKAAAEQDMSFEQKAKESDDAFLAELTKECEAKATLWDQRSKARADELNAISQAMAKLKDGAVKQYSANKRLVDLQRSAKINANATRTGALHRPSRVELARVPSFLQLSGREASAARRAAVHHAVDLLDGASRRLRSQALEAAVVRAEVADDHFVKVRGIIKDLMAKLEAQAGDEADQKSFCDKEMSQAVGERDKLKESIESSTATESMLETEKAGLTGEVADVSKEIAMLKKSLSEASTLRREESLENEKTLATAQEGKNAVELALGILASFYSSLQIAYVPPKADREGKTVGDRAPEVFGSEYKGAQDSAKGVTGLLDVILADFERTLSTVSAEEAEAAKAFKEFSDGVEADVSEKQDSLSQKQARIVEIKAKLVDTATELKTSKDLLENVLKSLSELKVNCVDGEETYEERVAKREKEIESLKQALAILDEWDS